MLLPITTKGHAVTYKNLGTKGIQGILYKIDEGEPFKNIFDKMIATSGITNNKNLFFFFWQTNNLHCYFQIQTLKED